MKIIINGKEREYKGPRITYAQALQLAFSHIPADKRPKMASATFFNANQTPPEGIFNMRTSIAIKEGTRITAHVTNNA